MYYPIRVCVLLAIAICVSNPALMLAAEAAKQASSSTAVAQANQPAGPPGTNLPQGRPLVPPQVPVDPNAAPGPRPTLPLGGSRREQEIRRTLNDQTTFEFSEQPLPDAINYIKDKHRLEIVVDTGAMREAGIDPSTTLVSLTLKDISLRSALNLLLSQFNLTYVIKDEVLVITTKAQADKYFDTRLYDVRDLVVRDDDPNGAADFDSLLYAIRSTVNPQSWDRSGSSASMSSFNNNGICALIVVQTFDGQEQVQNLLFQLRRMKPQRAPRLQ